MHTEDPYTILAPRPCRVTTPEGVQDGLVIGRRGNKHLVLHHTKDTAVVSWAPSPEVWLLDDSDWAPWSAAIAANA